MNNRCDYCDCHDRQTGMKELNKFLLDYQMEVCGAPVEICAVIQDGTLRLEGENVTLDSIAIAYCPVCGRKFI